MTQPILSFFTDPILRAPTIGCMLMCLAASLIGVIIFLRKESLIGEALSHAAYPGVILGALFAGIFAINEDQELLLSCLTLLGAFLTANLGLGAIQFLERKLKVPNDAALCFVLASFFGIGLTLASEIQFSYTSQYKQVMTYLYGQAATMTDIHVLIYGLLVLCITLVLLLFYKELQVMTLDYFYAKSLGLHVRFLDGLVLLLVTLSVIIGIRSVGVVLMSAMFIAPVVAARQLTHRLPTLFVLSGLFGMVSGFLGNYFSIQLTFYFSRYFPSSKIILPTGPMIVICASLLALSALFLSPDRGIIIRSIRAIRFRYTCLAENLLKVLWRLGPDQITSFDQLMKYQKRSRIYLKFILWRLYRQGWIQRPTPTTFTLTVDGQQRAAKIVRFHRLWEVYLVNYLGWGTERVHKHADEIEHIITPEIEKELIVLLNDPKKDPHAQPIPSQGEI